MHVVTIKQLEISLFVM